MMYFLLTLLLFQPLYTHGFCAPAPGFPQISWFGTCKREHAQLSIAMWIETMLMRGRIYPESSYKSSYDAIKEINENSNTPSVLTWNHVYQNEYIISHIILTKPSRGGTELSICGIIENPDNVIYNKSIIPMVDSLREKMEDTNLAVDLDPLRNWSYGIYFAALTMKLPNK
jgi:hypothetical protein